MHDDLETLASHLNTRALGRAHEHHAEVTSTNDRLAQWAKEGAPDGAVVTADVQTQGRGRRGRVWSSQGENLYVSVLLRPGRLVDGSALARDFSALGLVVAVGLARGLEPLLGRDCLELKWPNDLLVGGRKLGGILCESRWLGRAPEVVVGFGINVRQEEFDAEHVAMATSLARLGVEEGRPQVLARVLGGLESAVDAFVARGFARLRGEYEARCPMLRGRVRVDAGQGGVEVQALGVDRDGALRVREEDGQERRVCVGDVVRARVGSG